MNSYQLLVDARNDSIATARRLMTAGWHKLAAECVKHARIFNHWAIEAKRAETK